MYYLYSYINVFCYQSLIIVLLISSIGMAQSHGLNNLHWYRVNPSDFYRKDGRTIYFSSSESLNLFNPDENLTVSSANKIAKILGIDVTNQEDQLSLSQFLLSTNFIKKVKNAKPISIEKHLEAVLLFLKKSLPRTLTLIRNDYAMFKAEIKSKKSNLNERAPQVPATAPNEINIQGETIEAQSI